ncbi:MAG TPA: hypothetical protein VGE63_00710 [Candidatus Paceibacterota bacterium]
MDKSPLANSNGQDNHGNGQENVWLEFITDNKDFLVSFRTRVRKISSALYMLGNLWQEDDFGKHLHSVSLTILSASKIPVTDNRHTIMNHFMSVKESVEYALSLIIFGAEAGLLATSNVTMITPFCIALLGDLHDLENTLPALFNTSRVNNAKSTAQAPDASADLANILTKDHGDFFNQAGSERKEIRVPVQPPTYIHTPASAAAEVPVAQDIHTLMSPTTAPVTAQEFVQARTVPVAQTQLQQPVRTRQEATTNQYREAIFAAIKASEQQTPSELQAQFPALSAKRIQRELQQLVQEKRVIKKGEKRWVSYHLNAS